MKKTTILILVLLTNNVFSQQVDVQTSNVVSAPVLEGYAEADAVNALKALEETVNQSEKLSKTYKVIKNSYEILKKVNNVISKSNQSYIIVTNTANVGNKFNEIFNLLDEAEKKGVSKKVIKNCLKLVSKIDYGNSQLSKDLNNIVTNEVLTMNDYERLSRLDVLEKKSNLLLTKTTNVANFLKEILD